MTQPAQTQPDPSAPELRRLAAASPAERDQVRAQYLAWLDHPDHDALQITGRLFAPEGPQAGCCAVGALLTVLESAGFARIEHNAATVRVGVPDLGVRDRKLSLFGGMAGTGDPLSPLVYPEELADALGLGLSLDALTSLNDDTCDPKAFGDIADWIREQRRTLLD